MHLNRCHHFWLCVQCINAIYMVGVGQKHGAKPLERQWSYSPLHRTVSVRCPPLRVCGAIRIGTYREIWDCDEKAQTTNKYCLWDTSPVCVFLIAKRVGTTQTYRELRHDDHSDNHNPQPQKKIYIYMYIVLELWWSLCPSFARFTKGHHHEDDGVTYLARLRHCVVSGGAARLRMPSSVALVFFVSLKAHPLSCGGDFKQMSAFCKPDWVCIQGTSNCWTNVTRRCSAWK